MSKLVSVVIPIYNCEKHLNECIDSVIEQTYKNIEILLIDDGSTDSSGLICDSYQNEKGIKAIHIKNNGVANARNIGIKESKGDYIVFLDSDDKLEKNAVETLVFYTEKNNADFAIGSFYLLKNGIVGNSISYLREFPDAISITDYLSTMLKYHTEAYWGANWGKLFKKSIIIDNNILFEENVQLAEDFRFNLKYLKFVNTVSVVHNEIWFYRVDTSNSLSKKKREPKKYIDEYFELFRRYKELYISKDLFEEHKGEVYAFLVNAVFSIFRNLISYGFSVREIKNLMKSICLKKEFLELENVFSTFNEQIYKKYVIIKKVNLKTVFYYKLLNIRLKIIAKVKGLLQ